MRENIKKFKMFIESVELTMDELEDKKIPNYTAIKDFEIEEDGEAPLFYKGANVYWDAPGERLIILSRGNIGMIVDLTIEEFEEYFKPFYNNPRS